MSVTLHDDLGSSARRFGLPGYWYGTLNADHGHAYFYICAPSAALTRRPACLSDQILCSQFIYMYMPSMSDPFAMHSYTLKERKTVYLPWTTSPRCQDS